MASWNDNGDGERKRHHAWAEEYINGPFYEPEPSGLFATAGAPLPTPPTSSDSSEGPGLIRRVSIRLSRAVSGRGRRGSKLVKDNKDSKDEERPKIDHKDIQKELKTGRNKPLPPVPPPEDTPQPSSHETRPEEPSREHREISLQEIFAPLEIVSPQPIRPIEIFSPREIPSPKESLSHRKTRSSPPPPPPPPARSFSFKSSTAPSVPATPPRVPRRRSSRATRTRPTASPLTEDNLRRYSQILDAEELAMEGSGSIRRASSLRERFPHDPTVRPLDMLRRDHRAADRAPHLHNTHRKQPSDTIDMLDQSGSVPHHHEGPFDAASLARNYGKRNAPIDAVQESNMEALKATPREYIQDSTVKHMPLQGTAVIPPGHLDMSGNVMDYVEGTDLNRARDASGGPMGRWDVVDYHPDDLKGKGEPSYTVEKELKEHKARLRRQPPPSAHSNYRQMFEMQPVTEARGSSAQHETAKDARVQVRQRRRSATVGSHPSVSYQPLPESVDDLNGESSSSGVRRNQSTTDRSGGLATAIKRRWGSLRQKRHHEYDDY